MAKSKYFPDLTNGESVADVEQIETAFSLVEKDMENAGEKADQTFSSTSKNAQSGVAIDGELKKYQKKLNFDTAPKQGSTNPVTSDGVWNTWVNLENTMTSKTQSMVDKKVDKETGKSLSTNDYIRSVHVQRQQSMLQRENTICLDARVGEDRLHIH